MNRTHDWVDIIIATTYPCGISSFGGALDLPREAKVGDLAHEGRVDEHIAGGQVLGGRESNQISR